MLLSTVLLTTWTYHMVSNVYRIEINVMTWVMKIHGVLFFCFNFSLHWAYLQYYNHNYKLHVLIIRCSIKGYFESSWWQHSDWMQQRRCVVCICLYTKLFSCFSDIHCIFIIHVLVYLLLDNGLHGSQRISELLWSKFVSCRLSVQSSLALLWL